MRRQLWVLWAETDGEVAHFLVDGRVCQVGAYCVIAVRCTIARAIRRAPSTIRQVREWKWGHTPQKITRAEDTFFRYEYKETKVHFVLGGRTDRFRETEGTFHVLLHHPRLAETIVAPLLHKLRVPLTDPGL